MLEPLNGKIACKLKRGTAYCRYKCHSGFILGGNGVRATWCQDGEWKPRKEPRCEPDPNYIPKGKDVKFARSNVLGSVYLNELKELFGNDLGMDL